MVCFDYAYMWDMCRRAFQPNAENCGQEELNALIARLDQALTGPWGEKKPTRRPAPFTDFFEKGSRTDRHWRDYSRARCGSKALAIACL
jgi:hypothetical protein